MLKNIDGRVLAVFCVAVLVALGVAGATARGAVTQQPPGPEPAPSVDALLSRIFSADEKDPYDLTAEFNGSLTLVVRGSRLIVAAAGAFEEWRTPDGAKHRRVAIRRLDVPVLLRPFSGLLRQVIEQRVQTPAEGPEAFYGAHDIFILEERPSRRYVLVGVRRDLVDEALDRYGSAIDKNDPLVRRKIAQWLYTSPAMRGWIVRPGPPYAFAADVDEVGLIHELVSSYDWGQVDSTFTYTSASGQIVLQRIAARFTYTSSSGQSTLPQIRDTVRDLAGLDRVEGQVQITFTNHCLDCRRP